MIFLTNIETPIGKMTAGATEQGLCLLEFSDRETLQKEIENISSLMNDSFSWGENRYFELLQHQLHEYFKRIRIEFSLPLILTGTDFQKRVWIELQKIPYGSTRTYLQQSEVLNNTAAIRAVASANAQNHIAILIPCHRVVGKGGKLTGYAGGLWRKQWLLELESKEKKLFL